MNPYTSLWTGVTDRRRAAGAPRRAARQRPHARAARRGRPAGAALHPLQRVPERLPGLLPHRAATRTARCTRARSARSSTPQLIGIENAASLPFASSLCGACYEVCPVKIDIPKVLLHLRAKAVRGQGQRGRAGGDARSAWLFGGPRRLAAAQRLGAARAAAVRARQVDPQAARAAPELDAHARPAAGRRESFRAWWRTGATVNARAEILARIGAARRPAAGAPAAPIGYRRAGTLGAEERRRALLPACRRVPG